MCLYFNIIYDLISNKGNSLYKNKSLIVYIIVTKNYITFVI